MTEYGQIVTWQPNQQLDNGKYTITDILGGGRFGSAIKTLYSLQETNKTIAEFTSFQVKFVGLTH